VGAERAAFGVWAVSASPNQSREPLTPTLSPQGRGEGEVTAMLHKPPHLKLSP
jgi:hypothetical protein